MRVRRSEWAVLLPLAAVTLYMGIIPSTAMDMYHGFVAQLGGLLEDAIELAGRSVG